MRCDANDMCSLDLHVIRRFAPNRSPFAQQTIWVLPNIRRLLFFVRLVSNCLATRTTGFFQRNDGTRVRHKLWQHPLQISAVRVYARLMDGMHGAASSLQPDSCCVREVARTMWSMYGALRRCLCTALCTCARAAYTADGLLYIKWVDQLSPVCISLNCHLFTASKFAQSLISIFCGIQTLVRARSYTCYAFKSLWPLCLIYENPLQCPKYSKTRAIFFGQQSLAPGNIYGTLNCWPSGQTSHNML